MIEYRSVADLSRTISRNITKVPNDLDLVVGVPRSGLLAANILALYLNLPLTDLDGLLERRLFKGGERWKSNYRTLDWSQRLKILILDDSIDTGRQLRTTKAQIAKANLSYDIIFGAVYASPRGAPEVDMYFEIVSERRVFEWNIMNCWILKHSCVDIDGVLCRDPTEDENDDGINYENFLLNAEPIFVPKVPIGWLVTCRLEKYRRLTEEWLTKHQISYRELIMLDMPSKAARAAANIYGKFKAKIYADTEAELFIESSESQAREIAELTGKQVFCIETHEMITAQTSHRPQTCIRSIPRWLVRGARSLSSILRG